MSSCRSQGRTVRMGDNGYSAPPALSVPLVSAHPLTLPRAEDRGHQEPQFRNPSRKKSFLSLLQEINPRKGCWPHFGHMS